MNKTKWTPGPWKVCEQYTDTKAYPIGRACGVGVTSIFAECSNIGGGVNGGQGLANARLISKAPEMVAVLRQCEAIFNVETIDPMKAFIVIEKIRALLSEIEG